jgi:hypothetical protein
MKGCNDNVSLINASLDIVYGVSYLDDASLTPHVSWWGGGGGPTLCWDRLH